MEVTGALVGTGVVVLMVAPVSSKSSSLLPSLYGSTYVQGVVHSFPSDVHIGQRMGGKICHHLSLSVVVVDLATRLEECYPAYLLLLE